MIPNTPPGPTACCAMFVPPHAAADLASKTYVHSSGLAATKATDASVFLANGSLSQRREMMLDFRRILSEPLLGNS